MVGINRSRRVEALVAITLPARRTLEAGTLARANYSEIIVRTIQVQASRRRWARDHVSRTIFYGKGVELGEGHIHYPFPQGRVQQVPLLGDGRRLSFLRSNGPGIQHRSCVSTP